MNVAAIVPAAGRSERMGRPKLILPIGGRAVIARVVGALREGGAGRVVVVGPTRESDWCPTLVAEAERAGATTIVPASYPPDMRASVEHGLDWLERREVPDAVLITPGDSPGLKAPLVARVIAEGVARPGALVVPAFRGRRGHPLLLPWPVALRVRSLPADRGINALLSQCAGDVVELACDDAEVIADLDTPADYRRWEGT